MIINLLLLSCPHYHTTFFYQSTKQSLFCYKLNGCVTLTLIMISHKGCGQECRLLRLQADQRWAPNHHWVVDWSPRVQLNLLLMPSPYQPKLSSLETAPDFAAVNWQWVWVLSICRVHLFRVCQKGAVKCVPTCPRMLMKSTFLHVPPPTKSKMLKSWAQLFEGRLALNTGLNLTLVSFSCV